MFDVVAYNEFCSPNADRCAFIQKYLFERGVESAVINVDGRRHIYAKLPPSGYSGNFRIKTVIAHYDRFEKKAGGIDFVSPGANDNSSSVFCLMDFAARLAHYKGVHNVRIFFTDGEELSEGGVIEQGAYKLADVIKKAGIKDEDIYVFDCMGRGTVPILGTAVLSKKAPSPFAKKYAALEQCARGILSSLGISWLNLPIPYSDNAGFLASGIPAVAFTMLPDGEAQSYMYALQKVPELLDFVQNRPVKTDKDTLKKILPETWLLMHTSADNVESLTPISFEITAKILDAIAARKTM